MRIEKIEDAYTANEYVKNKLIATVSNLSDEQALRSNNAAVWNAKQLVEHIAMVDEGILRICDKLLSKAEAEGLTADGACELSDEFKLKTANAAEEKYVAPAFVHPSGTTAIADSLAKLNETDEKFMALKARFEQFDGAAHKFPHPLFGDLSANEWLVLPQTAWR
jgi:quinolinate synthase